MNKEIIIGKAESYITRIDAGYRKSCPKCKSKNVRIQLIGLGLFNVDSLGNEVDFYGSRICNVSPMRITGKCVCGNYWVILDNIKRFMLDILNSQPPEEK
jgi:hypothetical protein